jgi:molybdopterin-binding protein
MKLRARNVLKGRVVEVVRGATTAHVKIDIGGGGVITASSTVDGSSSKATWPTPSSKRQT